MDLGIEKRRAADELVQFADAGVVPAGEAYAAAYLARR